MFLNCTCVCMYIYYTQIYESWAASANIAPVECYLTLVHGIHSEHLSLVNIFC